MRRASISHNDHPQVQEHCNKKYRCMTTYQEQSNIMPPTTGFPTYRTHQIAIKNENVPMHANSQNDVYKDLEVDYDNNVTDVYRFISNSQWQEALRAIRMNPVEARTWVVRYHEDEDKGMMWRFLPIHSAAARQPPEAVMVALIEAYPEGAQCCDDQGKYALHYASGNQASAGVIHALVDAFPSAATTSDPEGKLPLHWMAISGPFETGVIEPLAKASKQLCGIVDDEGWTPLDYAREANYPYRQVMVDALQSRNVGSSPRRGLPKKVSQSSIPSDLSYATGPYHSSEVGSKRISSSFSKYNGSTSILRSPSNISASTHSIRSISTNMTRGSVNKTVAKYNAQIVKLKAEQAFNEAEHEEAMVTLREDHEEAAIALEVSTHKEIEKNQKAKRDQASKEQFIAHKETRIAACDKEMSHYEEQNARLQDELMAVRQQYMTEKMAIDEYKLRITTLQSKMTDMSYSQEKIYQSLESIEADAKKASDARRQKLQALFDDELKDSREMADLKRVYGKMAGGPTIREALVQQKNLMKNCEVVLEECDARDDVDGS